MSKTSSRPSTDDLYGLKFELHELTARITQMQVALDEYLAGNPTGEPDKHALSIKEAAEFLEISESTMRRMLEAHNIPTIEVGKRRKIPRRWLEEQYRPTSTPSK